MADYLNIAGRVRTTAADGVAVEAQEIKDLQLDKNQQEINADVQTELSDRYTKEETYSQEQLNSLITTPDVEYVSVVATDQTTDVTDVLPEEGAGNTIYRVANWDGTQYDSTVYSLYAWNSTGYVCLAVRSFVGEVYDISANHPDGQGKPTPYADLAAALAYVPIDIRHGGMSVNFIQIIAPAQYSVSVTEGLTEQPTGTELLSDPDVTSGTYTADQLTAFSTLPTSTGAGNAVTYWLEVSGDTTTYTTYVITLVQVSDDKYVQYRLMSTAWSIVVTDWAIADEGVYVENPEFVYVKTDAEGKILWAIKKDGSIYYGAGVPQQVIDYIEEKIADLSLDEYEDIVAFLNDYLGSDTTLKVMIDGISAHIATKVDKVEGKSLIDAEYASTKSTIDNPEFLEVTTDSEDKVLEGIQADGTKVIGGDLNVKGSAKVLGNMEVSGVSYKVIENPEYLAAWIDAENKVIFGLRADGKTYVGDADFLDDIKDNQEAIAGIKTTLATIGAKVNSLDIDALSSITATENPEFIEATTDSEGKLLAGRTPDGAAFENVGFSTPKVSIDGHVIDNIEDPEGRTEILTDSEGKVISYRDSEGVKHEEVGIDSAVVNTNSLKLSDEGMSEFQQALIESGFNPKSIIDWSDEKSLKLPSPKCAKINFIISHNYSDAQIQQFKDEGKWPNILLPTTKTTDLECVAEYWDMLGNYYKKPAVLNAQGNSSMIYKVKNLTYDLDDGSEISFGGWVMQDSFHMKFYYQDFLKVYCIAAYRIGEELIKYKNCRSNRNKVGKNDSHWNFGATTNTLENNVVSGALCHPDGFGVEVYINGEYQGLYIMQLKKHRKNYDMDKKNYEEVLIDNVRSFTQPVWTDFEIKNPKTLICMDGTKYDDDNPKELIDATSEFYNPTNKDHKNTVKTKNEILRLCSAMSTIISSDNPEEKFLEFFDKDMLEVYFILYELLYGYDNGSGNWVWSCFDKIWAPNFYDLDTTCGKTASGTIIFTDSVSGFMEPNAETSPLGFVWANYRSEIVALWNELRNKKIIDVDNLISFYECIMHDIGINAYEKQYEKYPTLPSYRNSTFDDEVVLSDTTKVKRSDYWEVTREAQDWNEDPTNFDDTRMYVVGDTCKVHVGLYNHIYFRCKQNIPETGLAPMTFDTYVDKANGEPVSGGFYDSIDRIKKWFNKRIAFLDTRFINN